MRIFAASAVAMLLCGSVVAQSASATDDDTLCASVYTYLAGAAHENGMAGGVFEAAAEQAQRNHLAATPGEDSERYAISVIDAAQTLRASLANGTISSQAVMTTANNCNQRYGGTQSAQAGAARR